MVKEIGDAFDCRRKSEVVILSVHEAVECAVWVTSEVKFNVSV